MNRMSKLEQLQVTLKKIGKMRVPKEKKFISVSKASNTETTDMVDVPIKDISNKIVIDSAGMGNREKYEDGEGFEEDSGTTIILRPLVQYYGITKDNFMDISYSHFNVLAKKYGYVVIWTAIKRIRDWALGLNPVVYNRASDIMSKLNLLRDQGKIPISSDK